MKGVRLAVLHRHRVSVNYRIRAAHGALVPVEDRLTPVFNSTGKVVAIEGIIDPVRSCQTSGDAPMATSSEVPFAAHFPVNPSN